MSHSSFPSTPPPLHVTLFQLLLFIIYRVMDSVEPQKASPPPEMAQAGFPAPAPSPTFQAPPVYAMAPTMQQISSGPVIQMVPMQPQMAPMQPRF